MRAMADTEIKLHQISKPTQGPYDRHMYGSRHRDHDLDKRVLTAKTNKTR